MGEESGGRVSKEGESGVEDELAWQKSGRKVRNGKSGVVAELAGKESRR